MKAADKEAICRLDGMDYALRRIEKIGTEEFRKELKVRYRNGLSIQIPPKELCDASDRIKEMCLDTVLTMATLVLHDEFDFGKKRVQRFYDRFMKKADCLRGDFVTWQDYSDIIKEELGININIRMNE